MFSVRVVPYCGRYTFCQSRFLGNICQIRSLTMQKVRNPMMKSKAPENPALEQPYQIIIKAIQLSTSTVGVIKSCHTRRSLFLGRFWTKIQFDNCFETVSTPGLLLGGWHCSSTNFVYNFNKTPWFPLMWMVRFVTFVHKYIFVL